MCPKESVEPDQWDVESKTENVPTEDVSAADSACEWFDEEQENTWAQTDILDIIQIRVKEVKKFHTPRAFKAFADLTAIMQYIKLRERYRSNPRCKQPCLRASLAIATRSGKGASNGAYFARRIRKNEHFLQKHGRLPPSKKDALHGHLTLLDNENVKLGVRKYLAAQSLGTITTKAFCQEVNEVIVPSFGFSGKDAIISERTARNWLHKLGYSCVEVRKGLYHDGHERPDVVEARKKFLEEMAKYERCAGMCTLVYQLTKCNGRFMYKYDDVTMEQIPPQLGPGEKLHVLLPQDECITHVNETPCIMWLKDGEQPL